ncbi:hypothetical protein F5Y03DRAFT_367490 [Xylaria venustula]|nr:hypothetical protein F5Y03DRAFT_367490 [Xylaria venustula]
MFSAESHRVSSWAHTAGQSTRTDIPCDNAQPDREYSPIVSPRSREISHLSNTEDTTYGVRYEQHTRPIYSAKRRRKRQRVASLLSGALKSVRGALLNLWSPAHDGTKFLRREEERSTTNDILSNDPGPWHEYGRLDSDGEDDRSNSHCPKKKIRGSRFRMCRDRFAAKHEGSLASHEE